MHLQLAPRAFALLFWCVAKATAQGKDPLLPCGDAFYHASEVSTLRKGKENSLMHDLVYLLSEQFPLSGAQWYTFKEMRRRLLLTQSLWV